jgi:hypothetical protein
MASDRRRHFLQGLSTGAIGSLAGAGSVLYLLSRQNLVTFSHGVLPDPNEWTAWVYDNLGSSLPVFAILLAAFFVTLARLREALECDRPIERIVQLDHLADTWTTLFFGTGVIWTAIGMRSALIFALGEPDTTIQQGAFAVLKRLVDGGILLALSTTIVGGMGGYLMRVYKSVSLGSLLQQRYDRAARVDTSMMKDALHRIEAHIRGRRGHDRGDTA